MLNLKSNTNLKKATISDEVSQNKVSRNLDILENLENSNKELINQEEVKVFFTQDPELLQQYYKLRHDAYKNDNGFEHYNGSESEFDRIGKIVVAMSGNKVVGGARLMFSDRSMYLSCEIPGTQYDYRKFISKYDKRENLIVSEVSAYVVSKPMRDSKISTEILKNLIEESERYGCNYMFAIAGITVCRNDRRTAKRLGYDLEVVLNFPWQQKKIFNFIKAFLMYIKLN